MGAMKWSLSDLLNIERHVCNQTVDCPHPQLKDLVLSGSLQGSTPLLMACHLGNLDSVKRITEVWGVDVNATGVYYGPYYGDSDENDYWHINDASPIFVAARTGRSEIVHYLLQKSADATVKTPSESDISSQSIISSCYAEIQGVITGLTTLHAAVSSDSPTAEKIKILRLLLDAGADPSVLTSDGYPIWMMKFCGLDAITILLEHSPNSSMLTQVCPSNDETVLHQWASTDHCCEPRNSLAVVELLLAKGADLQARDSRGYTPILSSILSNDRDGPNLPVLNYLLERGDIDRLDKINAMELAGAILLMNNSIRPNPENVTLAFGYWRRASQLRQMATDGCVPIPKELLVLNKARPISSVVEWNSPSQLEELVSHPSEYNIQVLLVRLRISFSISWEAVYEVFLDITNRLSWGWLSSKFEDVIEIVWICLEAYFLYCDSHQFDKERFFPVSPFKTLVDLLRKFFKNRVLLDFEPFLETSLKLINAILLQKSYFDPDIAADDRIAFEADLKYEIKHNLETFLNLISILANLPQKGIDRMMPFIRDFLALVHQEGPKLLLLACSRYRARILKKKTIKPNALATVRLLLQAGADPDGVDYCGNTPRHLLADTGNETAHPIGVLLLNAGAYLDRTNIEGKTAAQLWMEATNPQFWISLEQYIAEYEGREEEEIGYEDEERGNEDDSLPDWCRSEGVPTLFRLSGRVIRTHQIPFGQLPEGLSKFITSLKK